MERSDWMTAEETTKHLGIGKSKLYNLAQDGEIPRHKVGKTWKFHRNDLDAWVRASRSIADFFTTVEYEIDENTELPRPPTRGPRRNSRTLRLQQGGRAPPVAGRVWKVLA